MGTGINSSLRQARFKVRLNLGAGGVEYRLSDQNQVINLVNMEDLTYSKLTANLNILKEYNQWRIDGIKVHWRMLNKNAFQFKGAEVNHALVYEVPNDSTSADGSLETLMYNTNQTQLLNLLKNYTQLAGVRYKKVSYRGGSYWVRPHVDEAITTLNKFSTAAPTQITDIRRNYKKTFRYASTALRYQAPVFMVLPALSFTDVTYAGSYNALPIALQSNATEYPQIEVWQEVYVTARQYKDFTLGDPSRLMRLPSTDVNPEDYNERELNNEITRVKQELKDQVTNEITNSHPLIGAAAAVLGLGARKRIRHDEFKM